MFNYSMKSISITLFFILFFSNLSAQQMVDFGVDAGHGGGSTGACGMDGIGSFVDISSYVVEN